MEIGNSVYKIPEGKLLKVGLSYNEENMTVESVKLFGDFFVHPEEEIESIENVLRGIELDEVKIAVQVQDYVSNNQIEMLGITAEGIARGIMMCLEIDK